MLPASAAAAEPRRFAAKLPIPRVLEGEHLTIPIRPADVAILPGRKTRMWTFDGTFPGPTIRRPAGERTRVTFVHRLPRSAGELSVHLHGGHNSSFHDGQPGGVTALQPQALYCDVSSDLPARVSGNDLLIGPGERRRYVYDLVEDGEPERAVFQWYHDHRLERTAPNVWRGLAGMWIIDDEVDRSLPLPKGPHDIPLMIVDRGFDADNQLSDPFADVRRPPDDGVTGRYVLVNGAYLPHHHVAARRYRLRALNASNFRSYNLHLSDDTPLVQIGTDSGLMPEPVERQHVLIGPGERVEVVVDFRHSAGEDVVLKSVARKPHARGIGTKSFEGPIMQFRVGDRPRRDRSRVPAALRPLPAWTSGASPAPDRTWVVTVSGGFQPTWLINGQTFDPARSDAFPVIDTTETWQLTNATATAHVMHIHANDWYMLSRNGRPPRPWEDALKETFFLDPGESVIVAGHFSDHLGKFVIHCHMLDHEDHGLMTQFEVVGSAARQPARDEVARRRRAGVAPASQAPSLGLPDSGSINGSNLVFTPNAPEGEELRRFELRLDGRLVRVLRGAEIERAVRLRAPRGPGFRVTAVAETDDGRFLAAARDYGDR
jgi:FtsP/CotA-like multicopper oxidase with cupredoxin domain